MKLENAQKRYREISKLLIVKMRKKVSLYQKLQHSNNVYREKKIATLKPWEYKKIKEEINIIEAEIRLLTEERNLLIHE